MPNAASFQGSDIAHLLFTAICTFPNTVLHHHYFTATFSTCRGRQAALKSQDWRQNTSTASARLAFHGEKNPMHFGMHGLLPNAATPSPSNIPAREMRFFLPKARAQTRLWVSHTHTGSGSPEGLRNPPAAFEGRPRHPAPQAAPAGGQHLAAITRCCSVECKATIPVAEGTGRTNRTLYLHIKGSYSPRHHRKAA